MQSVITDLGKEIARMERQKVFERELSQSVNIPLTGRPASGSAGKEKTVRASEEYRANSRWWQRRMILISLGIIF